MITLAVTIPTLQIVAPKATRAFGGTLTTMQWDVVLGGLLSWLSSGRIADDVYFVAEFAGKGLPEAMISAFVLHLIVVGVAWVLRRMEEPLYVERAIRPSMTMLAWGVGAVCEFLGETGALAIKGFFVRRVRSAGLLDGTDLATGAAANLAEKTVLDGGWLSYFATKAFTFGMPLLTGIQWMRHVPSVAGMATDAGRAALVATTRLVGLAV
jgi:hypothetical protein